MVGDRKKPPTLDVTASTAEEPASQSHLTQSSDRVTLTHPSGATATILLYGATVISWTTPNSQEQLWLSSASALDGSKAVRGGIPLVFPVFGPPPADTAVSGLAQHGFARTTRWELMGRTDEEAGIRVDFALSDRSLDDATRGKWAFPFMLIYSVTLTASTLETKMVVQNTGEEEFNFNVLFHTYLRVPDVSGIAIKGLKSLTYRDKTLNYAESTEESDALRITAQTDRVYRAAPDEVAVVDAAADTPLFTLTKLGLNDVVVWNPYDAAEGIADWQPKDGYKQMVCVEAGSVAAWQTLEGGAAWEGGVVHKAHL